LNALQQNGGFTETHALRIGSLAINAGSAIGAPVVDQRGAARDANVDIGAYEFVAAVSNPPVAANDSYAVNEDAVLTLVANGILANDTDADSDPLTAHLISGPSNGVLNLNSDGSLTYTPDANFSGVDSFTYRASDGNTYSGTATVSITVNAVNDAPIITSK
jgi:VCBS repeat-containing protein